MLEKTTLSLRGLGLAVIFVLAIALLVSVIGLLVAAIAIATLTGVFALLAAPKETKAFFTTAERFIDSWVQAMVKLVTESGELVKSVLKPQEEKAKEDDSAKS